MAELRPHIPAMREAGADVYVIGTGWPAAAHDFREKLHIEDVPVLCDQRRASYQLLGMRRDVGAFLKPAVIWHGTRALLRCNMQGRTMGDNLQQGGVLIVNTDGNVRWNYLSRSAGDHPKPKQILAALTAS